jgi:serine/threonine-protein kinase
VVLPSSNLKDGAVIGGFNIIRKIGEGGMGSVYLAKQISMNRNVALKVLSKNMTGDKDVIEQFRKEVQLSGKLEHPNIVRAIDAGETEKYYYMAMTYVDGEDYQKALDRKKVVPEAQALNSVIKIAEVLSYAWEKHSLLHKDVKPGNIMINRKDDVFLVDLGIAQSFDFKKKDADGHAFGSPFYMSPEQAQRLNLDWRSDLYSLGATLYHMTVGLPPYDANTVSTIIDMHTSAPFPEPKTRNPSAKLSPDTISLMKKMLAKKAEDRFGSWKEFIDSANAVSAVLKKAPKKKVAPNKPAAQKKNGERFAIFALLSGVAAIGIVCFIIAYKFHVNNINNKALAALQKAENYLSKFPGDYDGALGPFGQALFMSKNTGHHDIAQRRYAEIKKMAEDKSEKLRYFDKKLDEAQIKAAEKQYTEALEILRGIENIDDSSRRKTIGLLIMEIEKIINEQK